MRETRADPVIPFPRETRADPVIPFLIDLICFIGMGILIGYQYVTFLGYSRSKKIQYFLKYGRTIVLIALLVFIVSKISNNVASSLKIDLIRVAIAVAGIFLGKKIAEFRNSEDKK